MIAAPPSSRADLRDPAVVRALVADARPDVVYHLAARAHVGQSWEDPLGTLADNVAMTANVLEAVRHEAPGRRGHLASARARSTGRRRRVPTTEDAPLRPQNPYAVSKASSGLVARFYADAHGLRVIHARAFNHAGPGQEPIYAIANFARQFAAGLDAGDDPVRDRLRQPRHAPRLHRRARHRARLPAARRARRARRLQRLLRRLALRPRADRRARPRSPASPSTTRSTRRKVRAHEVQEIRGSSERLHAATGWTPEIPLEQTLADTLAGLSAAR